MGLKLFSKSYISIDGSKFKAVKAKDNNFTLNKLDDRIRRLDEHISLYMEELDAFDREEERKLSKDELQQKLEVCKERKEGYEEYRNTLEESDGQKSSNKPADLKACLQAGIIPDAYKGILTDAEKTEIRRRMISTSDSDILRMNLDEKRKKALEGFFVRDAERNPVYCPQGEILRQKSVKRNGSIRYCNKLA